MLRHLRKSKLSIALAAAAALYLALASVVYLPLLPKNAPTILVSVDRTLWNRVGLNRLTHVRALRNAGIRPRLVDFDLAEAEAFSADELLDGIDGLVLSGGGDVDSLLYGTESDPAIDVNHKRDAFELALLAAAERSGIPVLGLCRGAQLINVYHGGTLGDFRADSRRYDVHHRVFSGHPVDLQADSRLASIFEATRLDNVVTYHGQYVKTPGTGVRIVGYAPDGTPEAIEVDTGSPFGMLGVQWHAEAQPGDDYQARLFRALSKAATARRAAL